MARRRPFFCAIFRGAINERDCCCRAVQQERYPEICKCFIGPGQMTRYFLAQGHDKQWWLVDANYRDEWQRSLDEGGAYEWQGPDYAEEVDLAALTFTNPELQ